MAKVVVIGGGIAGLVAARKLAEGDHSVTLLEASASFGGKTQTVQIDGSLLEAGPEWLGAQPENLLKLVAELNLEAQPLSPLARSVRKKGKDWSLSENLDLASGSGLDTLSQLPLSRGAKWKLTTERFTRPSDAEENLADFVTRRLGVEVWEILEPVVSAQWGGPAADLSVHSAFTLLENLETQGGLVTTSRKRLRSARYTISGGLANLTKALAEALLEKQVALLARSEALGITRERRNWKIHLNGNTLEAAAVVVALPAPQAAKFFRPSAAQIATSLNHFKYNHAAKVWLVFRSEQETLEFFPAIGEGFDAQAIRILEPSQGIQWIRVGYAGEKARANDGELSRLATHDVQTLINSKPKPAAAFVFRQPNARAQFSLGHERWVKALEGQLVQAPGVFLSGSYLAGPDLAQSVQHAQQTANHALDFLALANEVSKV